MSLTRTTVTPLIWTPLPSIISQHVQPKGALSRVALITHMLKTLEGDHHPCSQGPPHSEANLHFNLHPTAPLCSSVAPAPKWIPQTLLVP